MSHPAIKKVKSLLSAKASAALVRFADDFFTRTPSEDMDQVAPAFLKHALETHFQLSSTRKDGKIALTQYITDEFSFLPEGKTVIDIVQNDAPFLIDSVVAEIGRQGHTILMLIHPILYIRRDKTGKILDTSPEPRDGYSGQSHMHIQIKGTLSHAQRQEVEMGLHTVLADVRHATRDWHPMREKLRAAQKILTHTPARYDRVLIKEYQEFLEYLFNNNFTLLGYREYKFSQKKGAVVSETIKGSSLGLLRDEIMPVYINEARKSLTQQQQKIRQAQAPLTISKINKRSTVHRRVLLDAVTVKIYDSKGDVTGEILFIGLFTSVTFSRSVEDIPYLRLKVQNVMTRAQFMPGTHSFKALRHILEKYPRDEVLQISEDDLLKHTLSILRLQERPRIALYTRPDPFGRYISCLVYVPRERHETRLRLKIQHILEQELQGKCTSFQVNQDDSPLARIIFWIDINHLEGTPVFDAQNVEEKLQSAGQIWAEHLRSALETAITDTQAVADMVHKYGMAFPIGYQENYRTEKVVHDIRKIEDVIASHSIHLDLYRPKGCADQGVRLKIFAPEKPVTLSDVLPMLENMGVRVISELPFEIQPARVRYQVWIHDFLMEIGTGKSAEDIKTAKPLFEDALAQIWAGQVENDGLNKLILLSQMTWRDIVVLRTYVRYMQQIGSPFSRSYIENALTANPQLAKQAVLLFHTQFDPALKSDRESQIKKIRSDIDRTLETVETLDQDRILRSLINLVESSLRTNFYQTTEGKKPKAYLSIKFDSAKITGLPDPKPYREIFVYSPRVEGIHLRADKIARGGFRWSDRHEDFRTEILGLMKAQQVKNAVIVPMGAKGGFVVKQPPKEGGRPAFLAEGVACYKTLVHGLLDITDNRSGEKIIPPHNVVRRDEDDPYLVAAADKGTATFSDIANSLSAEHGFWLGDAFASGGSQGYDHKKMGITAKGAWESVKRHFRELGFDTQKQPFDVIGVGDMGGDVFGNGMLLSPHIRLVGAFNHAHIFCDPEPDIAQSFAERQRLFTAVKGWDEYNTKLLSKGGRIFQRTEKSLILTPEIRARFHLTQEKITPAELIQAMLRTRTDLLWFGGIGTYIKASSETHAQVGDKGNDSLRVDASEVKAKVIGEGANLAVTQRARIEYALLGGKLNADYIDNSGGVDSSDHEVNIKILLTDVMRKPKYKMDLKSRNKLLASMTDEVAAHVLRNSYQQSQGISLMELQSAENVTSHRRLMAELERKAGLNRKLEALPDNETLEARQKEGKGLTRPELAVLQSYAKIWYTRELLSTDIPESSAMEERLFRYFPKKLSAYAPEILAHRLKREIVCTSLTCNMVNRMGPTFLFDQMRKRNVSAAEVARAYIIVREAFGMRDIWNAIEALDGKVPAQVQLKALKETARMIERAVTWFLTRMGRSLDIERDIAAFKDGISAVKEHLDHVVTEELSKSISQITEAGLRDGLPKSLAHDVSLMPILGSACDIIRISTAHKTDMTLTARTYFALGEYFHLDWMRHQARFLPADERWSAEALEGLIDQLYTAQAGITVKILRDQSKPAKGKNKVRTQVAVPALLTPWLEDTGALAVNLKPAFDDLRHNASVDLPMLVIAEQKLRGLY
jgi:glutamate dehydrogenase